MADTIDDLKQRLARLDNDPRADVRQKIDCLIALATELKLIDPASGIEHCQRAFDLSCSGPFPDGHYQSGVLNSRLLLGILNYLQGNYRQALAMLFDVIPLAEAAGDLHIESETLVYIARIYNWLGDLPVALDLALKAIEKSKAAGNQQGEADAHNTIGIIHSKLDNHQQGLIEFYRSLELSRDIGNISGETAMLNDIAMAHMALSDYDKALTSAAQSLELAQQKQLAMLEANVLCTIGEIWLAKDDKDQALAYFQTSIAMSQRLGFKYVEMYALMTSGHVYLLRDEVESALSFLQQALGIANEIETKSEISRCHLLMSEVYKQQRDFEAALYHHEQYHAVHDAVFNEESDKKIRNLQIVHETETAQKEAEIYRLKNVELEKEIAERKRAEAERRASKERYRALFERTNDAIFIFGLDSSVLEVNQRAADLLGYGVDEIVGQSTSNFIDPAEEPDAQQKIQALLKGARLPTYHRNFMRKDGTRFPAEINVTLVTNAEGRPSHMHSVFRDITERQQMEQQRLDIAMEREKSRILTQFVRDALHEFRTPLSIANINLYMLDKTIDNPQQQTYIRKIQMQSENIKLLVETLVNMSKMDSGQTLVFETLAINPLIDDILTSRQVAVQEQKLVVSFVKDENLPLIQGDVEKLSLALGGIFNNAMQHTPAGGTIRISTYLDGNYVVTDIRDTGAGIHTKDLPRIFERFWRKDEAHSTRGFGLGLPIAKQIVDMHQGRIEVESTLGIGSLFKTMLPINQENQQSPD